MNGRTSQSHSVVRLGAWTFALSPAQRYTLLMYCMGLVVAVSSMNGIHQQREPGPDRGTSPLEVHDQTKVAGVKSPAQASTQAPVDVRTPGFAPPLQCEYDPQAPPSESKYPEYRARGTRVRLCARQAKAHIEQLLSDLASWRTKYAPLGHNDSGRRIAPQHEYLQFAIPALRRKRPTDDELIKLLAETETLSAPQLKGGSEHLIENSEETRVGAIRDATAIELRQLETDRLVLDSLLLETRDVDPGKYTLDECIEQLRTEREKSRQVELTKAEREASAIRNAVLAKANKERTARRLEADRQSPVREADYADQTSRSLPRFVPPETEQRRLPASGQPGRKPSYFRNQAR